MTFLNSLYRHGLWISPLAFVLFAGLLAFFIMSLIRLGDKSLLAAFPLQEQQMVQFSEAGSVVLSLEGPRLSKRFSELSFVLVPSDGAPIEGRTTWFHARRSGLSIVRMELLSFELPGPGQYILQVRNLGGSREGDGEHKIVFTRARLPRTVGFILGIIVSGGMVIGSVVLFILRLLSKGGNP
jgi:hypothetical protein